MCDEILKNNLPVEATKSDEIYSMWFPSDSRIFWWNSNQVKFHQSYLHVEAAKSVEMKHYSTNFILKQPSLMNFIKNIFMLKQSALMIFLQNDFQISAVRSDEIPTK